MTPSRRYDEALAWASELHRGQKRKGTEVPYVAHLLAVSSLALEAGAGEDEAIAALLHDAVEDQGGAPTLARIRERFGDVVADIVDGCTESDQDPKPPWKERKEAYLAHLAEAPANVRLVSLCDKLHNARNILSDLRTHGPAVWDRFTGGRDGSLWYYTSLVAAYRRAGMTGAHLDELARTVDEMARPAG
jgi:(p)ppGpp synthase/HD superfamily hydrolase